MFPKGLVVSSFPSAIHMATTLTQALESLAKIEARVSALVDVGTMKDDLKEHFDTVRTALNTLHDDEDDDEAAHLPRILTVDPGDLTDEELRIIGWSEEYIEDGMTSEVDLIYFFDGEAYYLKQSISKVFTEKTNVKYRGKTWGTMLTVWH